MTCTDKILCRWAKMVSTSPIPNLLKYSNNHSFVVLKMTKNCIIATPGQNRTVSMKQIEKCKVPRPAAPACALSVTRGLSRGPCQRPERVIFYIFWPSFTRFFSSYYWNINSLFLTSGFCHYHCC